jgi:2-furoyl-CoA dehydrogenase FAD binding subunit
MKPVAFDYYRPETVAETTGLLAEMREDAAVMAGGMTLGPMLNLRVVRPRAVVDVSRLAALKSITEAGDKIVTGAMTVQREALVSTLIRNNVPLLTCALPWVGHFQTRNRGTLGGSVAHADPSAEIPLCLVVTDGWVVLQSRKRERRIAAREFFQAALTTQRRSDELIVRLEWPQARPDAGHAFIELAQRHGDFALVSAACQIRLGSDGRVAALSLGVGGVESRPLAFDMQNFIGISADEAAPALAEHAATSVSPNEDHLASAQYRLALTRELVARAVAAAIADAHRRREALQ